MTSTRMKRVTEEYKNQIAKILNYDLDDPRIPEMLTVTYVKVSNDLTDAVVYVSVFTDSPEQAEEAMEAIEDAHGYIKRLLSDRIKLKRLPDPHFKLDTSIKKAFQVYDLLDQIKEEQAQEAPAEPGPDEENREG